MKDNSLDIHSATREVQELREALAKANEIISNQRAEIEDFSFAVSHNLRGPIASLKGVLNLVERDELGLENASYLEHLDEITQTLDDIVEDLNGIVKVRHDVTHIYELVDLKDCVDHALSVLNLSDELANVDIELQLDIDEVPLFLGVKKSIKNILTEVIRNAVKFRSKDRDPILRITAKKETEVVCISIIDNGIGIDLENVGSRIFKPFTKLTKIGTGTGLGLYLVRLQMDQLGGTVALDSKPDIGTAIEIRLPLYEFQDEHLLLDSEIARILYYPELKAGKSTWKKSITVAEFDEIFRFIVKFMQNYQITSWIVDIMNSQNDEEALNKVRMKFSERIKKTSVSRMALIASEDLSRKELDEKESAVARNYTFPVRIFTSIEAAREWIIASNQGKPH